MELQQNLTKIRAQGLGVAAISYDKRAVLEDFAKRRGITYPLLSDPDSAIIRAFGILNESAPKNTPFFGIPYPGTYIVNAGGVVTAKYFEEDFRERDTSSEILVRQFGAAADAGKQTVETKHLKLISSASAAVVRGGQRIALVLELDLKPKMHVYAPGVANYIPVEWTMNPNPAMTAGAVEYPKAQVMELPAINEKVPVYTDHVRLVREIVIGQSAASSGDVLTITGAFRYQACDDRICYIPVAVPVEWKLKVEQHDRERAPAGMQRKPPG